MIYLDKSYTIDNEREKTFDNDNYERVFIQ